ncbi:MAG: amidohydrolase family protein [Chloroflexi bacterium]|nr:amidohydrolase family protein [Chloroflexota bacterium]
MSTLLLRAAQVIDGNGGPPLPDHEILIDGERIVAVGPRGSQRANGAAIVETKGTVLPGLVNMHAHLRGFARGEPPVSTEMAHLRAAKNARFSIQWGCTSLRDAGSTETLSQTIRDAIDQGLAVGPRVWSSGRIITTSAGHGWSGGRIANDAAEMRVAVRKNVEERVDTIKIAATGGGGTPGSNVGMPQYTAEELTVATYEAHRLGKRVLVHCNGSIGTRNAVEAKVDTIEHIGWMGMDGKLDYDPGCAEAMIANDITVVPTMSVWYRPGYDDWDKLSADQRKMRAAREERTAAWLDMFKRGVRFATGTDTWDPIQRELELMVSEMRVTPMDAIVAATRNSAIGLGALDDIGTIEKGKLADLLEVDGDPVADVADLRKVARVWKAGEMVVEDGRFLA